MIGTLFNAKAQRGSWRIMWLCVLAPLRWTRKALARVWFRDRCALSAVRYEVAKRSIFSRGRFGGWKYEVSNQDHSAMAAIELVDRLLLDKPESTYVLTDRI